MDRDDTPPSHQHPSAVRIRVGVITGARGLRGEVWIRSFTANPADVGAYGAVTDADGGSPLTLTVRDVIKGRVVASVRGIVDRSDAEALKGRELYVSRTALPTTEADEFYHADLEGMTVLVDEGEGAPRAVGTVKAVHDFGAGAIIEVESTDHGSLMVPFSRAAVPVVDMAARRLIIAALPGIFPDDPSDRKTGQ